MKMLRVKTESLKHQKVSLKQKEHLCAIINHPPGFILGVCKGV